MGTGGPLICSPVYVCIYIYIYTHTWCLLPLDATITTIGCPKLMHQRWRWLTLTLPGDCLDLVSIRSMWYHIPAQRVRKNTVSSYVWTIQRNTTCKESKSKRLHTRNLHKTRSVEIKLLELLLSQLVSLCVSLFN